jgi:hypothetical protein
MVTIVHHVVFPQIFDNLVLADLPFKRVKDVGVLQSIDLRQNLDVGDVAF